MLPAKLAKLLHRHTLGMQLLVLRLAVVTVMTLGTLELNNFSHEHTFLSDMLGHVSLKKINFTAISPRSELN